jgi:hypothetical protein
VIRLQPIQIPQTFNIIPSSYDLNTLNAATVTLVENGFSKSYEYDGVDKIWSLLADDWNLTQEYFLDSDYVFNFSLSKNGNYIEVEFQAPITLKEGEIYTLTLKNDDNIFYKDLIYIGENQFDYIWSLIDEDWDTTEKDFIDVETSKKDVFTLPDNYDEYNPGKTEYIVL